MPAPNEKRLLLCGCQRGLHYCPEALALRLAKTRARAEALSGMSDSFGSDAWERYHAASRAYEEHFDIPTGEEEVTRKEGADASRE